MKIIIAGDPKPQARMRHFVRNGYSQCYDPVKKEKDFIKSFLEDFISDNYHNYQFPKNPHISFYFYCPIPSSMNKKLRWYAERGLLRKRTRPDSDNYVKLYLDCMNEIIFEDDSHVSLGECIKFFHKEPKTVIYVDEAPEILNMPLDEMAHFSESCEWIREKMACLCDYISRPYEGFELYPEDNPPAPPMLPS
jgi:Holliday junction resolvase RusA-like endonuclease